MLGNIEPVVVYMCLLNINERVDLIIFLGRHMLLEKSLYVAVVWVHMHVQYEEDLVQCESPL